jgi:branched-chain amino acid aminotransferase
VIALLRHKGFEVTERVVSMKEIVDASQNGTLEEAFGTGTAVGIAMIDEIGYRDQMIKMPESNPVSQDVNQTINRIKTQTEQDPFGWIVPVMEKQLV